MVTLFHSLTCFCHLSLCAGFYGKEPGDLFHPELSLLLVIFILLLRLFHTHVELGKLEEKVNRIVQDMALKEREERDRIQHLKKEQEDCK